MTKPPWRAILGGGGHRRDVCEARFSKIKKIECGGWRSNGEEEEKRGEEKYGYSYPG